MAGTIADLNESSVAYTYPSDQGRVSFIQFNTPEEAKQFIAEASGKVNWCGESIYVCPALDWDDFNIHNAKSVEQQIEALRLVKPTFPPRRPNNALKGASQ